MNKLSSSQNYHDLSGLDELRKAALSGDDDREALKQAAKQFESIFTQMMFKSMRKANAAFEDSNNPFNASSVKYFRDMHDQQLALEISQSGSLGLADIIVQQLSPEKGKYMPGNVLRNGDFLPRTSTDDATEPKSLQQNASFLITDSKSENQFERNSEKLNANNASNDVVRKPTETTGSVFETTAEFVEGLWDSAKKAADKIGLNPAVMLAQAALETGWGRHVINKLNGESSFNFFNIKANNSWQGDKAHKTTLEFEQGLPVKKFAAFRAYDSIEQSFDDFVNLISSKSRYQKALNNTQDEVTYLTELQSAGYATDPNYASKIIGILKSDTFSKMLNGVVGESASNTIQGAKK
ncbi:flagellar assembly peptidoglycan hydrolase FlgJ [Flocculibacter collagenilyticus]|uniref:flagellar assembly peptidoglycan hydrolase FlgJ n=1 Tax=Flocculibacter collagenilyticus TaxID=2744479 RepID=UPI0018F6E0D7|nr:flagellar assembly peptidoglycan hydrolase FlgJ [Flocculibacter collagenilyticus]